jgi:hypothetical protein
MLAGLFMAYVIVWALAQSARDSRARRVLTFAQKVYESRT